MTPAMSRTGCLLMLTVLLGGLALAPPARSGVKAPDGQPQPCTPVPDAQTLLDDLRTSGFQVGEGYAMLYEEDACANYTYPALQSCFGNNPVSPYVMPVVKAWPNEYVGPTPVNTFGEVRPGYIPTYRLDPRDAVIIYGCMPPPGKYMSLATVEWSQHGRWTAKDYDYWANTPNHTPMRYVFSTIPPDDPKSERTWSLSTLGDSVNNVVMQEKSGEDPFGQVRYFITTPSASTDRAVRRVLWARGVRDEHIFTEQIPSRDDVGPIGPLGMGKDAIDFWTLFKYAIPDPDQQAAAAVWWASFKGGNPPLQVMRVRAPASVGPVQRYDLLTYDERTANSELTLADDLRNLVDAVCDRVRSKLNLQSTDCTWPPPDLSHMADVLQDFGWAGPYCRSIDLWCGDQPDAGLFGSAIRPLDDGQVYAVVATLATATGNATYVGLSVNDPSTYLAPAGGSVTDAILEGSAGRYHGVNNANMFFVHYFTRDCRQLKKVLDRWQDCTEITEDIVPKAGDPNALGDPTLFGMFMPYLRNYVFPGNARGPDTRQLLRPRILTFTPQSATTNR